MKRQHVLGVIALFLLLAIDQGSKYLAVHFLQGHPDVILIPGVFQLEYLENRGAAFGILQNQRVLLLIVTLIIFGGLCYFYCKMGSGRKWRPLQSAIVLIAAGAIGNMIDRFARGYVVDFFYFSLIHFPVFNVADCYVVVGAVIALLLLLFYYKEEDFEQIFPSGSSRQHSSEKKDND